MYSCSTSPTYCCLQNVVPFLFACIGVNHHASKELMGKMTTEGMLEVYKDVHQLGSDKAQNEILKTSTADLSGGVCKCSYTHVVQTYTYIVHCVPTQVHTQVYTLEDTYAYMHSSTGMQFVRTYSMVNCMYGTAHYSINAILYGSQLTPIHYLMIDVCVCVCACVCVCVCVWVCVCVCVCVCGCGCGCV